MAFMGWISHCYSKSSTVCDKIYLIESKQPKHALISATACDNGDWISLSSDGISGPGLKPQRLPFAITSVNAISCSQHHIDMALDYGPIATSKRSSIKWRLLPVPFEQSVRHIKRTKHGLFAITQTSIWQFHQNNWKKIKSYEPTIAQHIYEFHAGWFKGTGFSWLWTVTGVLWVMVSLSGFWIFYRMIKNLYKKKTEI